MKKYNTTEEIKNAILRADTVCKGIALPSGQRIGTFFQKMTYARMQAEKLYEEHFKLKEL